MGLLNTIFGDFKLSDVFVISLLSLCFYVFHFYYKYFTRVNPLPGPVPIPLIGSFAIFKGDIDAWFYELNAKYGQDGVYELNIAGNRQIVITRAEYVEKFFTSSSTNHLMRTANNGLLDLFDLDKKGVGLNHSYNFWKFNRQIFSQAFMPLSSNPKTVRVVNDLFEEMSNYWMGLRQKGDEAATIDMPVWMRRFTCDFISVLATKKKISALNTFNHKSHNEHLTQDMIDTDDFVESINTFFSDNQIIFVPKILRSLPLIKSRVDHLLGNCQSLYGKLVKMIRTRRKEIEKNGLGDNVNAKQLDLLTTLVIANTQYDINPPQKNVDPSLLRPMTDDEIRGIMFDAFVAGTDTTVNTFCFVLYYISHNPNVKRKLLEEINSIYKDDPNRPITLEDLDKLKYCEAIIKETSRIRPTVSMISRYSSKTDEIAGYKWPSSMLFIMYARGINNNPIYWKDPEKFMPERFYETEEIENRHKHSFLMFGGGLRTCLGRKVAIVELKTLLALLYRKFDVELVDMNAPPEVETSTITICKGLNVRIIPKEKIL